METSTQAARRRILLADDNVTFAKAFETVLILWGFEVTVVHDGAAAVQSVRASAPAVALLDLRLPRMDGLEAARRIRADPSAAGTLLVALTGSTEARHRKASLAAGFDHYLVKPVDPAELRRLIESAL